MPLTDIAALPPAPQRTDPPELFNPKADAFVASLSGLVTQINALSTELEVAAALLAAAPAYADPGLKAMTGNTPAADRMVYFTGAETSALAALTAAGRALIGAADAAAQRVALGLGSAATQSSSAFDGAGSAAAVSGALSTHAGLTNGAHGMSAFGAALVSRATAALARDDLGIMTVTTHAGDERTISFAGGAMILKMGYFRETITDEVTRSVVFASAFPNACWTVMTQGVIAAASDLRDLWTQVIPPLTSVTGFTVQFQDSDASDQAVSGFDWWAFGN